MHENARGRAFTLHKHRVWHTHQYTVATIRDEQEQEQDMSSQVAGNAAWDARGEAESAGSTSVLNVLCGRKAGASGCQGAGT